MTPYALLLLLLWSYYANNNVINQFNIDAVFACLLIFYVANSLSLFNLEIGLELGQYNPPRDLSATKFCKILMNPQLLRYTPAGQLNYLHQHTVTKLV